MSIYCILFSGPIILDISGYNIKIPKYISELVNLVCITKTFFFNLAKQLLQILPEKKSKTSIITHFAFGKFHYRLLYTLHLHKV